MWLGANCLTSLGLPQFLRGPELSPLRRRVRGFPKDHPQESQPYTALINCPGRLANNCQFHHSCVQICPQKLGSEKAAIKESPSRPQMEMWVQRQLSKNVMQRPTLGPHRPVLWMEQLPGACLRRLRWPTAPSSLAAAFPKSPQHRRLLSNLGAASPPVQTGGVL